MEIKTQTEFFTCLDNLVKGWCDRYCFRALRHILPGYPITSGLTDDYADLLTALKNVRSFAKIELTQDEIEIIDKLIKIVDKMVYRR